MEKIVLFKVVRFDSIATTKSSTLLPFQSISFVRSEREVKMKRQTKKKK
jgi:hypothetical protein